MLGKQFPSQRANTKTVSKPIAVPIKREYSYDSKPNPMSAPNTPPNEFVLQLHKRLDQLAISPVFVYNLRS